MAELVGLAASIIQIAGAGTKLSTTLYTFLSSAARADQEISDIAGDVEITATALSSVGEVFKHENAKSVVSTKAVQDANNLIQRCEAVFGEIQEVIDKRRKVCKDGKKKSSTLGKLSWPMKEQRVELLRRRLESLKNSLMLLLHVLQLAQGQANGKMEKDTLNEERENIRRLYERQQDSLKSLQALESKLAKVNLSDDEDTLKGSNVPSRVPTIDLMVNKSIVHPAQVSQEKFKHNMKPTETFTALTDNSDTSDSDRTMTDEEGEEITKEELIKCAKHVQRLLKRISSLQQTFETSHATSRYPRNRVHKLYRRFCRRFESDIMPHKSVEVPGSLSFPEFKPPSAMDPIKSKMAALRAEGCDISTNTYNETPDLNHKKRIGTIAVKENPSQRTNDAVTESHAKSAYHPNQSVSYPSRRTVPTLFPIEGLKTDFSWTDPFSSSSNYSSSSGYAYPIPENSDNNTLANSIPTYHYGPFPTEPTAFDDTVTPENTGINHNGVFNNNGLGANLNIDFRQLPPVMKQGATLSHTRTSSNASLTELVGGPVPTPASMPVASLAEPLQRGSHADTKQEPLHISSRQGDSNAPISTDVSLANLVPDEKRRRRRRRSLGPTAQEHAKSENVPPKTKAGFSGQSDFSIDEGFTRFLADKGIKQKERSGLHQVPNAMFKHERSFHARGFSDGHVSAQDSLGAGAKFQEELKQSNTSNPTQSRYPAELRPNTVTTKLPALATQGQFSEMEIDASTANQPHSGGIRKRTGHSRSNGGCNVCRKRKKKCDNKIPCGNCVRRYRQSPVAYANDTCRGVHIASIDLSKESPKGASSTNPFRRASIPLGKPGTTEEGVHTSDRHASDNNTLSHTDDLNLDLGENVQGVECGRDAESVVEDSTSLVPGTAKPREDRSAVYPRPQYNLQHTMSMVNLHEEPVWYSSRGPPSPTDPLTSSCVGGRSPTPSKPNNPWSNVMASPGYIRTSSPPNPFRARITPDRPQKPIGAQHLMSKDPLFSASDLESPEERRSRTSESEHRPLRPNTEKELTIFDTHHHNFSHTRYHSCHSMSTFEELSFPDLNSSTNTGVPYSPLEFIPSSSSRGPPPAEPWRVVPSTPSPITTTGGEPQPTFWSTMSMTDVQLPSPIPELNTSLAPSEEVGTIERGRTEQQIVSWPPATIESEQSNTRRNLTLEERNAAPRMRKRHVCSECRQRRVKCTHSNEGATLSTEEPQVSSVAPAKPTHAPSDQVEPQSSKTTEQSLETISPEAKGEPAKGRKRSRTGDPEDWPQNRQEQPPTDLHAPSPLPPPHKRTSRAPVHENYAGNESNVETAASLPSGTTIDLACILCRSQHLKCDGGVPCSRCRSDGVECTYIQSRRGWKGKRKTTPEKVEKVRDENVSLESGSPPRRRRRLSTPIPVSPPPLPHRSSTIMSPPSLLSRHAVGGGKEKPSKHESSSFHHLIHQNYPLYDPATLDPSFPPSDRMSISGGPSFSQPTNPFKQGTAIMIPRRDFTKVKTPSPDSPLKFQPSEQISVPPPVTWRSFDHTWDHVPENVKQLEKPQRAPSEIDTPLVFGLIGLAATNSQTYSSFTPISAPLPTLVEPRDGVVSMEKGLELGSPGAERGEERDIVDILLEQWTVPTC